MPNPKTIDPQVSQAAAALGKKGGSNGTGDSKRRDPEHYSFTLAEARRKAALRRKMGSKKVKAKAK